MVNNYNANHIQEHYARQHKYTTHTMWLKKSRNVKHTSTAAFWTHYNSNCANAR